MKLWQILCLVGALIGGVLYLIFKEPIDKKAKKVGKAVKAKVVKDLKAKMGKPKARKAKAKKATSKAEPVKETPVVVAEPVAKVAKPLTKTIITGLDKNGPIKKEVVVVLP